MAVPTYTTDLAAIDPNLSETTTGWTNIGTGAPANEGDYFIQGSFCVSKGAWSAATRGLNFNYTSSLSISSPSAVLMWVYYACPNALAAESAGGIQVIIGSSTTTNFKRWYVRGSDTYTYGGWYCYAVDPTVTADATTGSPTTALQYFGAQANVTGSVAKGNPFGVDALRYGREFRIYDGSTADGYATFSGAAATNDSTSNRWGLCQSIDGGYLVQGLMVFGYSAAVDFRDSNTSILIAVTKKVVSSFNAFEVRNASSRVDWTNISFLALGTTSRGNFITTDNADINITSCTFTAMGTFTFQSGATILSSTFRRCNLVTQGGAVFTGSTFDSTNDSAKAIIVSNPANIASCTFTSSGTKHGIEFTTQGTYSWSGNIFTGYAASDGSTGNEAVYNNCTPYNTGQTYASSNQDSTLSLRSDAGGTSAAGESFAAGATKILSTARFYLKKSGSPSGSATAKIYAVTGSSGSYTPTGAALATSENFNVASLGGGYAMAKFQFKLTNCISLTSGTDYFVILDVSATTSSSGNTIDVGYDGTPAFATGNAATYVSPTWTAQTYDIIFDCYTDGAIILNLSGGGTTPTIRNAIGCSTSISASVDISVYVVNAANSPLNDVQVAIFKVSDDSEIMNKDTGYDPAGDGYATYSYNGSTPASIYVRVRKSTVSATRYIPISTTGTIKSSTGYSATFTLQVDPNT